MAPRYSAERKGSPGGARLFQAPAGSAPIPDTSRPSIRTPRSGPPAGRAAARTGSNIAGPGALARAPTPRLKAAPGRPTLCRVRPEGHLEGGGALGRHTARGRILDA